MDNVPTHGPLESFRLDFQECWRRLPNKGFFFILAAAWIALFQFLGSSTLGYVHSPSLFRWMLDAYSPSGDYLETEDGYSVLVPFVVLALFWWKRRELMALSLRTWWPGLLLLLLGMVLHLVAYMIQQPKLSIIGFFVGLYGLTGIAWGPAWLRGSFFPFFLFAFCVPLGTQAQAITTPLRQLVAVIVTGIAHLGLAPDLVRQGTQLMDIPNPMHPEIGSFGYDIAPACSGIRSLASLLALTTIFGFVSFHSGWKRLLMVLAAFPLAVLGNVARITFTVVVAEAFGQDWGKKVETKFGFLTFAVAIAAILVLEHWMHEEKRITEPDLRESAA